MKNILVLSLLTLSLVGCDKGMSSQVSNKTFTGDNAISNYEWFKQQEADIRAKYKQEERAKNAVAEFKLMLPKDTTLWTRQDKDELYRLTSIATGIGYQVDSMVEDYNAKASMENRVIFKDRLPVNIFRGTKQILEFKYGI